MNAVAAPEANSTAIRAIDVPRTSPMVVMARSRRTRSAIVARSGPAIAPGRRRSNATRPTAVAPPSRNATIPSPTVSVHSEVHAAPNDSCARRRSRLRRLDPNASRTVRMRDRAGPTVSPAAMLATRASLRSRAVGGKLRAIGGEACGVGPPTRVSAASPGLHLRERVRAKNARQLGGGLDAELDPGLGEMQLDSARPQEQPFGDLPDRQPFGGGQGDFQLAGCQALDRAHARCRRA